MEIEKNELPDYHYIHDQELEILSEFRRLCEKYSLNYFLGAGTLLGAVRHQGFIPWDHDIDVVMPRADYDKLYLICQSELDERYFFQDYRSEPKFPYLFAKIRKYGTKVHEEGLCEIPMEQGIYIDVFPLDICPDTDRNAVLFFKCIELLCCAHSSKVMPSFVCGYKKIYMRLLFHILRRLPSRTLFRIRNGALKCAAKWSSGNKLCTVGGRHGYPKESFQSKWYERTEILLFEGIECNVPGDWDAVLTSMYGEYMQPSPEYDKINNFKFDTPDKE